MTDQEFVRIEAWAKSMAAVIDETVKERFTGGERALVLACIVRDLSVTLGDSAESTAEGLISDMKRLASLFDESI